MILELVIPMDKNVWVNHAGLIGKGKQVGLVRGIEIEIHM